VNFESVNLWSLWTCYTVNLLYCELVIFVKFLYYKIVILVNLLYHELWTCGICDLLSILFYCEVWHVYRSYFRFRPLPVYFPHWTFVSDVSEIPISFPFSELPFSILFPIKKYENGNGFSVYRPFPTVFIPTRQCPVRQAGFRLTGHSREFVGGVRL
jgi:hypothetical protein